MAECSPYDAREISNYILKLADAAGIQLTQMSILKIVFYAHGWYLATKGTPLFRQPVEAWEHGPVVKVVRDAFKDFGNQPITQPAKRLDLYTGELVTVTPNLNDDDCAFVKSIFDIYGRYNGIQLSHMTHERHSPWDKIWNSPKSIGRLGLRIKNEEIKEYFSNVNANSLSH